MHRDDDAIKLDGAFGSGGGQVLRTALSLSALLGRPFEISNIRAGRPKPGLAAQHLTSVRAAAHSCNAAVDGAELGSASLKFAPGELIGDSSFSFDCGTAGSTMLIAQTLLPILAFGDGKREARLVGGTENAFAPTSFFFRHSFLPEVRKMGVNAALEVLRFGWYPQGGGEVRIAADPAKQLGPVRLSERGALKEIRGFAIVSNLRREIAQRMKTRLLKNISEAAFSAKAKVELVDAPAVGQGAEVFVLGSYANFNAGFTALGERGKPSEKVAGEAFHNFAQFDKSGACVEQHLCDQLLLYCALAKGRSVLQVERITPHLLTNARVISQFLPDVQIAVEGLEGGPGVVAVDGIGFQSVQFSEQQDGRN